MVFLKVPKCRGLFDDKGNFNYFSIKQEMGTNKMLYGN